MPYKKNIGGKKKRTHLPPRKNAEQACPGGQSKRRKAKAATDRLKGRPNTSGEEKTFKVNYLHRPFVTTSDQKEEKKGFTQL